MKPRRVAAVAGLAYVALAAIEGMRSGEAPGWDAAGPELRSFFADSALTAVSAIAGAASLAAYMLFVVALAGLFAAANAERRLVVGVRWAGAAAAALAAAGLLASPVLAGLAASEFSDSTIADLHQVALAARTLAAPAAAAFAVAAGIAAEGTGGLPRPLARGAIAAGAGLAIAAAATAAGAGGAVLTLGFALQAAWILAVALWLRLAPGSTIDLIRRGAFIVLVLAAALVGVALLAVPGATGEFFSWGLAPEALAAFAGGCYVGAAATYGRAIDTAGEGARGLLAAGSVLSVSVLAITLTHLDQFDFDRTQAWAWVILFAAFSAVMTGLFAIGPRPGPGGARIPGRLRAGSAVLGAALGALALALWVDPVALEGASPFTLPPLGGRFAGSWVALVATLALWAAATGRPADLRHAAAGLAALSLGAFAGALRTAGQLDDPDAYLGVLVVLAALGVFAGRVRIQAEA